MIELDKVSVTFRKGNQSLAAVKEVSLRVEPGEILGVVGRSGAGKSTLVRTINLLTEPDEGRVVVDGVDLGSLSKGDLLKERQHIGMIFQHFNLLESKTAEENVALALGRQGRAKARDLLERVGLGDRAGAYPAQLSGGQKQRVAIARALAGSPKVLLCDEATSALDPEATKAILKLLRELNGELGITMVVITHEMSVVKDICHRVAVMDAGQVVEAGPVGEVFRRPRHPASRQLVRDSDHLAEDLSNILERGPALMGSGQLYQLTFADEAFRRPLIAELQKDYGITANILSGNVTFLNGKPFGQLLVSLEGQGLALAKAMTTWRGQGIDVVPIPWQGGKHEN